MTDDRIDLERDVLRLAVGDRVVYSAYGVGRVSARERKLVGGLERDCVVVDFARSLEVTMTVEAAADRLRPVADEGEFAFVLETLRDEPARREGAWMIRIRASRAKLSRGSVADLAELVRDGAPFAAPAQNGSPRLSVAERRIYAQARELLGREISSARGVHEEEADAWIETQLARPHTGGA